MIIQPEWGTRNVNKCFYESEARRIADLNEIFGEVELTEDEQRILIWLAGWDEYTIENVLSVIRKARGPAIYVIISNIEIVRLFCCQLCI